MNLSPTQRKILYIGGPIVAVVGLYMYLRSRSSTTTTTATTPAATDTTASNAPIGLDQETSFESQVTAQLGAMGQALQAVQAAQTAAPAPTPTAGLYPTAPVTSVPVQTAVPAPTPTSGTTTPTPAPAPTNDMNIAGQNYDYISTPAEGSVLSAAGDTIYAIEGSTPVAVVQGGQRTAAWDYLPPGTKLYDQAPA